MRIDGEKAVVLQKDIFDVVAFAAPDRHVVFDQRAALALEGNLDRDDFFQRDRFFLGAVINIVFEPGFLFAGVAVL